MVQPRTISEKFYTDHGYRLYRVEIVTPEDHAQYYTIVCGSLERAVDLLKQTTRFFANATWRESGPALGEERIYRVSRHTFDAH